MKLIAALLVLGTGLAQAETAPEKSEVVATAVPLVVETASAVAFAVGAARGGEQAEPALAIGVIGLLVAPSFGQIYAGEPGRAAISVAIRTTAAIGIAVGIANANTSVTETGGGHRAPGWAVPMIYSGAIVFAASSIWDLVDAHRAVRRERPSVAIAPTPLPGGAGMVVAGAF